MRVLKIKDVHCLIFVLNIYKTQRSDYYRIQINNSRRKDQESCSINLPL